MVDEGRSMTISARPQRMNLFVSIGRYEAALAVVIIGQAIWCGWLCARGWFYQDDLSALYDASGRRLGWSFLTMPVNDHLVPGYRLVFWLQRHIDPLNYANTVFARVLLQTVAIWLLYRLLVLLFGRRPGVLALLALYAVNPLIVSNLTWLTTAACLVPAEIAAILALDSHIRYTTTGRLRWAAASGGALLMGMCFWEKTAIVGVMLPVLSLVFLTSGTARERVIPLISRWRGWLLTAIPPLVFVAYFVGHHYGGSARGVRPVDLFEVVKTGWLRMAAPSLFGGPWRWFDAGNTFVSWSSPSTSAVVGCQIGFIALVGAGLRRNGARSLLAWSMPALSVILGVSLVAVGRFFAFGDLVAVTMRYSFDFALALTLGTALALLPSAPADIARRAQKPRSVVPPLQFDGVRDQPSRFPSFTVAACALLVISSVISSWTFERRWLQNPTEPYVRRLTSNLTAAGPQVNLYDTSVSNKVVPYFFGPTLHLSDLLSWTDSRVRFDQTDTAPTLVDEDGNLRAANLLPAAYGVLPPGQLCEALAQGVGTWHVPLTKPLTPGDGFLRMEYFQQRPSTLSVHLEDTSGALTDPVAGSRVSFPVTLGAQLLRMKPAAAVAVVIKSESASTNICIGGIVIGAPFATAPAK
jgi:hypothetical protein